jgi:hypothetical protein
MNKLMELSQLLKAQVSGWIYLDQMHSFLFSLESPFYDNDAGIW